MELWSISIIGGFLVLDTAAVLQVLVSQPLVSGTLIGWLMGDIALGMEIGLLFQLLWLHQLPVGAAKVPEGNLAVVISVILIFRLQMFATQSGHILLLFIVVYALLISYLGTKLVTTIRTGNIHLFDRISHALDRGDIAVLGKVNLMAIFAHFITMVVAIMLCVLLGEFLVKQLIPIVPLEWNSKARFVEYAVIGAGFGFTLHLFNEAKDWKYLAFGFLSGFVLIWVI